MSEAHRHMSLYISVIGIYYGVAGIKSTGRLKLGNIHPETCRFHRDCNMLDCLLPTTWVYP